MENNSLNNNLQEEIARFAEDLRPDMIEFLKDLIRIQTYAGHESPAVIRTMQELKKIGCDDVWMDSAGNALGRIGKGNRIILFNAHLDTCLLYTSDAADE